MKIKQVAIGKTEEEYLKEGIAEYETRIKHYVSFESILVPAIKKTSQMSPAMVKTKEAEKLITFISSSDFVVLLDERGTEMSSVEFANFLGNKFNAGLKTLVFLIGGPFGVDEAIKKRANFIFSVSKLTFSHQMVRLFFAEQIYRALTILKNESYHHE
ncbi:MAG: 23S rRNA (pseudouridine(1915)-N(3))-methyltransferase RlmH [Bacteroidetes bacterium]|nr:23S rRNA (pseudouridine(1915)-N(3))-methyltransferase RlmH [Bacteroidota bacterium]